MPRIEPRPTGWGAQVLNFNCYFPNLPHFQSYSQRELTLRKDTRFKRLLKPLNKDMICRILRWKRYFKSVSVKTKNRNMFLRHSNWRLFYFAILRLTLLKIILKHQHLYLVWSEKAFCSWNSSPAVKCHVSKTDSRQRQQVFQFSCKKVAQLKNSKEI